MSVRDNGLGDKFIQDLKDDYKDGQTKVKIIDKFLFQ